MSGGVAEIHKDTDPLVAKTFAGVSGGLTIREIGADFKSCGVYPGLAVRNVTDGSSGHVVSASEDIVVITLAGGILNTLSDGDEYEIYKTTTYNSTISTHYVDRRYGHKVTKSEELVDGIKKDELDIDEYERNVFSPGQPWKKL